MSSPAQKTSSQAALISSLPWLALLGALSLVVRGVQLSQRTLYWDDLVIPAFYRDASPAGWFQSYDGHVMPGAVALQLFADRVAPLEFWLPAVIIVLLNALALFFYAVSLRRLLPEQPRTQILTFVALAFSPFLMTASGWWSAALNALGWQLGMALVLFFASRASSAPKVLWFSVGATFSALLAMLFTEKGLAVVPAALIVVWLYTRRVEWQFWAAPLVTTAAWAAVVFTNTSVGEDNQASRLFGNIPETLAQGILPATLGGPWQWVRWAPSQAFAHPAAVFWVPAVVIVVALLGLWIFRQPKRAVILVPSLAFLGVVFWVLGNARTSRGTADLLTLTLHYYPEWWAWTILLAAVASHRWPSSRRQHLPFRTALAVALVLSSMASTWTWVAAWQDDPAEAYIQNLQASISEHPIPLLEQPVPLEVLTPLMHPHNTVASVTGVPATDVTDHPQVVDNTGHITEGAVLASARTANGPHPQCGYRVKAGEHQIIPIDHPLPFGSWVWEMNAVASAPGTTVTLSTPNGLETQQQTNERAVTVPVDTELGTQWVHVPGGGGMLRVDVDGESPDAHVCIGTGAIGPLLPKDQQMEMLER